MINFSEFLQRPMTRRVIMLLLVAASLYLMRRMLTLLLLTFIFIYLINEAQKFVYRHIRRVLPIKRSFVIIFIYAAILVAIGAILYTYTPKVVQQSEQMLHMLSIYLLDISKHRPTNNAMLNEALSSLQNVDLSQYAASGGKTILELIGNLGKVSFYILLSLILSLFFMLEKRRIRAFVSRFRDSRIGWLYNDAAYFGTKFINSFGKVIETQILISFINSVISVVILSIFGFPNIFGLWFMIFILGMVPVAGVFISLVPLSIIAYNLGGFRYIVYILILIAVLHALESYVLNPKLMSQKTKLPVFVTFLILVVAEQLLGVWGLIVGIPIVMFLLDLLDVKMDSD